MFNLLEIDIDYVFRSMLLLKKKKYAALKLVGLDEKTKQPTFTTEQKGLDIVRRDWSVISKEVGEWVVKQILKVDVTMDEAISAIRDRLSNLKDNIGTIPIAKFIIQKELAKDLSSYDNKSGQAHVNVARRLKKFGRGDVIPYIICEDGTSNSHNQRAYHPKEELSQKQCCPELIFWLPWLVSTRHELTRGNSRVELVKW